MGQTKMALKNFTYPVTNALKVLKHNGGIKGTFLALFRRDDFKFGDLIGEDSNGNRYYQNKYYFMGRSRWVEYSDHVGHCYDGSQIPAEWHRWMHYITDDPPTKDGTMLPRRQWMSEHYENFSGTSKEYVPYSTTRPKVEAW